MEIKKEQWAYLAGLMDGDGCVSITVNERNKNRVSFNFRIQILSRIQDKEALLRIHHIFKVGHIHYLKTMTNQATIAWNVTNMADCLFICYGVLPYLIIKKRPVSIFIKEVSNWKNSAIPLKGSRDKPIRSRSQMLHMLEVAYNLNPGRQVMARGRKRSHESWVKFIDNYYLP